jgi:hypothetical protein
MVRAILEGRKTQTRRPCKDGERMLKIIGESPYGQSGDRLWVRENGWQRPYRSARDMREGADTWEPYYYDADGLPKSDHEQFKEWGFKRRPSIHMPRKFCRLILEVTGVRVERLLEITVDDCFAEGIDLKRCPDCHLSAYGLAEWGHDKLQKTPQEAYWHLWDSINEARGYARGKNPWVWVIEFKRT